MVHDTILYISDQAKGGSSELAALEATGYAVVSTHRSTQAIALLFVMNSAAAVVIDQRTGTGEEGDFELVGILRSICPDIPILLLCRDQIECGPLDVDTCVSTGQPLEDLTSAVERLLTRTRSHAGMNGCRNASLSADHAIGD